MSSLNAVVAWLGFFAMIALATLVFGSVLLRFFGVASMIVPTVSLLVEANLDTADIGSYLVFVPMAFIGLGLWVLGHRIYRAQHGWWRSPVAARLWSLPARALRRHAPGGRRARPVGANSSVTVTGRVMS